MGFSRHSPAVGAGKRSHSGERLQTSQRSIQYTAMVVKAAPVRLVAGRRGRLPVVANLRLRWGHVVVVLPSAGLVLILTLLQQRVKSARDAARVLCHRFGLLLGPIWTLMGEK